MECCDEKVSGLNLKHVAQKRALYVALFLNVLMFGVEIVSGFLHHSTGLLADSVDMLGDAGMYGLTVVAIHRSRRWQAGASFAKGALMAILSLSVMVEAIHKLLISHELPTANVMGIVSVLALAVNLGCAWLLLRFRSDNLNMKSVWLCSRNDALANLGVLIGAVLVGVTNSAWPDALIGIAIAIISMKSSVLILKESRDDLRGGKPSQDAPQK